MDSTKMKLFLDKLCDQNYLSVQEQEIDTSEMNKSKEEKLKKDLEILKKSLQTVECSNIELRVLVDVLSSKIEHLRAENAELTGARERELKLRIELKNNEDVISRLRRENNSEANSSHTSFVDLIRKHHIYLDLQRSLTSSTSEILTLRSEIEEKRIEINKMNFDHEAKCKTLQNQLNIAENKANLEESKANHANTSLTQMKWKMHKSIHNISTHLLFVSIRKVLQRLLGHALQKWRAYCVASVVTISLNKKIELLNSTIKFESDQAIQTLRESCKLQLETNTKMIARLSTSRRELSERYFNIHKKYYKKYFLSWRQLYHMKITTRLKSLEDTLTAWEMSQKELLLLKEWKNKKIRNCKLLGIALLYRVMNHWEESSIRLAWRKLFRAVYQHQSHSFIKLQQRMKVIQSLLSKSQRNWKLEEKVQQNHNMLRHSFQKVELLQASRIAIIAKATMNIRVKCCIY